jgi:hypothetical protein
LQPEKPKAVLHAERALWAWTAWMCLFGAYQTSASIQDMEQAIATQLQGMVMIAPQILMAVTLVGYALLALTMIWIVLKIGAGKR